MLDIIFNTTYESKIDITAVSIMCIAGNLTIFAFGYPYIYRAISNLDRISPILKDRVENNIWRKSYPWFLRVIFTLDTGFLLCGLSAGQLIGAYLFASSLFLLGHIFYVMHLYKTIDDALRNPFSVVKNQKISGQTE